MSSHTVIATIAEKGHMVLGTVFDVGTADAAVEAFCAKLKLTRGELSDVIVLLGMTGSTLLHASKGIAHTHQSFSRDEMLAAFELVRPKNHWKEPIAATIPRPSKEALACLAAAVPFFTGSSAEFAPAGRGKVRVTAAGYYAAIGG